MEQLLNALKWRYATKRMNGTKVDDEKLHTILEAARLAPSSNGLHPYKIICISNQEMKEKIQPIAFNQPVITTCSHLLVFAGIINYTEKFIDDVTAYSLQQRGMPQGFDPEYNTKLKKRFLENDPEKNFNHIARQVYLGCGFALSAAAALQVDSIPMEGFLSEQLDEILELNAMDLKSILLMAIGYRDEVADPMSKWNKVRPQFENFVISID